MKYVICLVSLFSSFFASSIDPGRDFYEHIQNISAPTYKELKILQDKILYTHRPILDRMPETGHIPRYFRFLNGLFNEEPEHETLFIRSPKEERENCIIIYSSFNERYQLGVKRLVDAVMNSDYCGHLCYRIGGWPNIQNGDIRLIHVPFAFKPCFFKEMQKLGYKRVLWLDSSILPAPGVSLNLIFQMIKRIGFFIQANDHTIGNYMNKDSAKAFKINMEEANKITSCSASIIGLDLQNKSALDLLDAWYMAAQHPFAFFSDRSDQNALSILIHQMNLSEDLIPRKLLGSIQHPYGNLFLMDRNLVKDK